MPGRYPQRIVCLTEETTETLYLMGAEDRIVGISGFTVRPARARREKPKVSAFLSAKTHKIVALEPDLVVGFSDLQADVANELIKQGLNVMVFNQRSVQQILDMMQTLAAMLGLHDAGARLVAEIEAGLDEIRTAGNALPRRPRVYFEEWDEPMISAIRWVSELIEIAGGEDVFGELSFSQGAVGRVVSGPQQLVDRAPDVIVGSWCGKKFNPSRVVARPGFDAIPAVRNGQLHEIKSAHILQPGPAALTDGVRQLHAIIKSAV